MTLEVQEYPKTLGRSKIFGGGKVWIPSEMCRDLNLRDGDRVQFIEPGPGTLIMKKIAYDTGYRSFQPG